MLVLTSVVLFNVISKYHYDLSELAVVHCFLNQFLVSAWIYSLGLWPGLKLSNWFWWLRGRGVAICGSYFQLFKFNKVTKLNIATRCKIAFSSFQLSYYVLTIHVPTFLTVCFSWMSFWLDHKSAPARVMLTITTLLAMSTTTSSINSSLPPVAYTKV